MSERPGAVKFKGNPLTLVGPEIKKGDPAPAFAAVATDMSEKKLADYRGKVVVICSVPSLDTPVCDIERVRLVAEMVGDL